MANASTFVTVVSTEDFLSDVAKLKDKAAERLGGSDGIKLVAVNVVTNQGGEVVQGTFTRTWEDPKPIVEDQPKPIDTEEET